MVEKNKKFATIGVERKISKIKMEESFSLNKKKVTI